MGAYSAARDSRTRTIGWSETWCSRTARCSEPGCGGRVVAVCDAPLTGRLRGRTCGRSLCAQHRRRQIAAGSDVDLCPPHDKRARPTPPPSFDDPCPHPLCPSTNHDIEREKATGDLVCRFCAARMTL